MIRIVGIGVLLITLSSTAFAYSLSFDDIASGNNLQYYSEQYGAYFSQGFVVTDHSSSSWGTPYSGTNVLTWNGDSTHSAKLAFCDKGILSAESGESYRIHSLSGYFSTDDGIVIRMVAYGGSNGNTQVATVEIGSTEESWNNHFVEISSENSDIEYIVFEGQFSTDTRLGFCVDDVNIVPAQ